MTGYVNRKNPDHNYGIEYTGHWFFGPYKVWVDSEDKWTKPHEDYTWTFAGARRWAERKIRKMEKIKKRNWELEEA